ncbi:hypothetical protein RIF29_08583 [Crotalaria pallida]|uniref:FBD domain-containing protein n=1 Tax=Crotalaria pallida TaxID=3830 RepID=A0AAN9IJA7_CROPI
MSLEVIVAHHRIAIHACSCFPYHPLFLFLYLRCGQDTTMEIFASNKKQRIIFHDEPDIISNVPDCIIGHILSYLPTKDAVRTIILSKTWESKWTHITNLNIDDVLISERTRENRERFINFVNRVFQNLSSKRIHTFTLNLSRLFTRKENPCYFLPEWINSALELEVQNLCVEYITNKRYNLSISLLPSTSLVHLDLNVYCNIILSSSNYFRNLKVLKLCKIRFVGDHLSNQEDMVLNFPVLELLYVKDCSWLNVKNIIIEAPVLEKMTLLFEIEYNIEPWSPTFKVLSIRLHTFCYSGNLVGDIILSNPLSIVQAWINVTRSVKACKFLQQFREVNFLKLSSSTIQGLCRDKDYASTLPMFQSLIHLELELSSSFLYEKILLNLLSKSPILKNLEILFDKHESDKNLLTSKNLPHCFLSSLKDVTIRAYYWCANNLSLTKYILENTEVLEKLILKVPLTKKRQVKKELQIPNVSNSTILQVEKMTQNELASCLYYFHYPL